MVRPVKKHIDFRTTVLLFPTLCLPPPLKPYSQICDAVGYALVPATDFPSLADKVRVCGPLATPSPP